MAGQKGLSQIISYVFAVLLSVIVVVAISFLAYTFYNSVLQDEIKRELTQVSGQTSTKILELYSLAKSSTAAPQNSTAILLADAELNLPNEIASRNYKLSFVSQNQIINFVNNVSINNVNVTFSKATQGGKIIAETLEDPVVKIEYDLPTLDAELQGTTINPANTTLRYYRYNFNGTTIDSIVMGEYSLIGRITAVN